MGSKRAGWGHVYSVETSFEKMPYRLHENENLYVFLIRQMYIFSNGLLYDIMKYN